MNSSVNLVALMRGSWAYITSREKCDKFAALLALSLEKSVEFDEDYTYKIEFFSDEKSQFSTLKAQLATMPNKQIRFILTYESNGEIEYLDFIDKKGVDFNVKIRTFTSAFLQVKFNEFKKALK